MNINPEIMAKSLKAYGAGEVIFSEGEEGDKMFIILDGEVEILKSAHSGGTGKHLVTLGKGEFFGEMALIEDKPRSATALCKKDTKLLVMNEPVFESVIEKNPDFASKMIKNLAVRLRNANKLIEQTLSGNSSRAVMEGLAEYAKEKGELTIKGWRVSVPEFAFWAGQHLGVPERNVPDLLRGLIEKGQLVTSALGENEVIYPKRPDNS